MPDLPAYDVNNAPLDEFADPQSGIARILQQMQNTATRSRPVEPPSNAVPTADATPDELIKYLLAQQR